MKIKKITALFLVLIMLLSAVPIMASAASVNDLYYEIVDGEVTITGCDYNASGKLVIPSKIDGYPVTSIDYHAFYYCDSLTSITIPDSVTSIGDCAFYHCDSLTSVTIGNGVTSIGDGAFCGCTSLTSITIPDSVTSIGDQAFWDTSYYDESSNWKNGVLYIGNHLIAADISGSYSIKQGTKTIADYAFWNCTSLTSIEIPDSVISIGNDAFWDCTSLASVTIADSVMSIGNGAFWDCTSLTSIEIPDSVTSIGDQAFEYCTNLTSITIPDSVTSIGDNAFAFSSLRNITVDKDNKYYCNDEYGTLYNKNKTALIQYPIGNVRTTFNIPDGVTSIGDCAFDSCSSLTSVTIPDSVTSIGNATFGDCSGLTSITIPDSVKSIGDGAFADCTNLASIVIPNNVISIGNATFSYCTNLTNITISNSVTNIGCNTFLCCDKLTNITIPDSVTNIDYDAFLGCESLTSITIPDSVTSIGGAFYGCKSLSDVHYNGTEEQWNKIDIEDYGNEYLLNATIHFIDEHAHAYTHISIPATCTVDGMEYDICSDCGDVINSKVLTATGHNWSEWKTVLEPTGTTDGKAERKCSKCGDVETKVIAKLNVVKDEDTGIEIEYRDQFDTDIEIKVEEKFDGKSFQLVDTTYPDSKTQIFDITTYENGVKVQPDGKVTVRIPLPDGFGTKNIFVCYIDTESQNVTQIPAKVVDGFVEFSAEHFSEYAVVELSGKVEKISISDITVNYKDSAKITSQITLDGDVKYTTSFTSSDTSVATIDKDGRITTLHKGTTTVTCTVTDEYGNTFKDTCTVTVKFQWWQWIIWILLFGFLWY